MNADDHALIDDQSAFDALSGVFASAKSLAVDTESDSLYRYRERVCFLQIGVGGRAYLIDTLKVRDLSALAPVFANPDQLKILHGADYDCSCLFRDFGLRFENLFDTMIAAQLVGREQLGLAALVREFAGVELDKTLTKHDWGSRPLEPRYIRYLADDVVYLESVRERMAAEVDAADVAEEARLEFDRVARSVARRDTYDAEAFRRVKGARDLDHAGLSVLRELVLLRDRIASEADKPPFKVLGNQQLLGAASLKPQRVEELRRIGGFSEWLIRKLGRLVIDAVAAGVRNRENVPFRPPPTGPRPPDEQLAAYEALRTWRRDLSEKEKRTRMAVLPNHLLAKVSELRPKTVEELATVPHFGARRLARYGEAIVAITSNPPPLDRSRRRRPRSDDEAPE